jgi:hypothetical protein
MRPLILRSIPEAEGIARYYISSNNYLSMDPTRMLYIIERLLTKVTEQQIITGLYNMRDRLNETH